MSSPEPILVVDADPAARATVRALLQRLGRPVLEADGSDAARARLGPTRPALALLDVESGGFGLCRELHESFGDGLPVILLSATRTDAVDRVAGLLLGADDYVAKPFDPDELLARVRRSLRRRGATAPRPRDRALTIREAEILGLLADGWSQDEIGTRLVISPKTVATHIQHVLAKLGLHSRAQAVAWAHHHGLGADFEAHPAAP